MSPEATTTSFSELVVEARTCSLVKLGGDLTKVVQDIGPIFGDSIGEVKSNQSWQYNYVGVGFPTLQSLYLNFQSSILRDPILHLTVEVLLRLVL